MQGAGAVSAHVVHHQSDPGCLGIPLGDVGEEMRPVGFGFAFAHPGHPCAGERFAGHKDVAGSVAPVLVVLVCQAARVRPRWAICSCLQSSSVLLANIRGFCSDYLRMTEPEYSRSVRTCSQYLRRTCNHRPVLTFPANDLASRARPLEDSRGRLTNERFSRDGHGHPLVR